MVVGKEFIKRIRRRVENMIMKLEKSTLKRIQYVALSFSLLGYTGFTVNLIFSEKMNDFVKGFVEGMSFMMIAAWSLYMVWSAFSKRNHTRLLNKK
jgi:putative Mn2+ efflux pump MntP